MADAADPREYLLEIFEDLDNTEFGKFQWQLRSLDTIKKATLDGADREKTIDAILGAYDDEEIPVVLRTILDKMRKKNLLRKLPKTAGATGN